MEAASFQHYLETATLIPYEVATQKLRNLDEIEPGIELSPEDWVLGIYDMTGELMRFAVTAMATLGEIPVIKSTDGDAMKVDNGTSSTKRSVLTDMRELRAALEGLDTGFGPFAKDAEKKMDVMRQSVEKVEKALYGLIVRGAERPKGWMPDMDPGGGRSVEVES
jgi:predicted translin family RNA/ssDNA-binding protein